MTTDLPKLKRIHFCYNSFNCNPTVKKATIVAVFKSTPSECHHNRLACLGGVYLRRKQLQRPLDCDLLPSRQRRLFRMQRLLLQRRTASDRRRSLCRTMVLSQRREEAARQISLQSTHAEHTNRTGEWRAEHEDVEYLLLHTVGRADDRRLERTTLHGV